MTDPAQSAESVKINLAFEQLLNLLSEIYNKFEHDKLSVFKNHNIT